MATIQEVVDIAKHCAFDKRLTKRSKALNEAFSELSSDDRRTALAAIESSDIPERIARRVVQISNFNRDAAKKITDHMSSVLGDGFRSKVTGATASSSRAAHRTGLNPALEFHPRHGGFGSSGFRPSTAIVGA